MLLLIFSFSFSIICKFAFLSAISNPIADYSRAQLISLISLIYYTSITVATSLSSSFSSGV
ncbi:hypothetical protein DFH27DRAFT_537688 [Peziza echinospora]|nr:hypothetical protein DFH27DRAFT_537688 [Peziza echinospora]